MPNVQAGALWWAIQARDDNLRAALRRTQSGLTSYRNQVKRTQAAHVAAAARARRYASSILSTRNAIALVVGGTGLGLFVRRLLESADVMTLVVSRLKLVTDSSKDLVNTQRNLFAVSQRTGASFEKTVNLYARVARATKALNISQSRLLTFVRAINESLVISGATAAEAANGLIQLSQGLASNRLGGDELRSTLEQLPRIGIALADSLKISLGEVRELGHRGGLTASVVLNAIIDQAPKITAEFQRIERTVQRAFTELNNQYLIFIQNLNRATQGTQKFISALDAIRSTLANPDFQQGLNNLVGVTIDSIRLLVENFRTITFIIGGIYLVKIGLFIRRTLAAVAATSALSKAQGILSRVIAGSTTFDTGAGIFAAARGTDAARAAREAIARGTVATKAAQELSRASKVVVAATALEVKASAAAAAATRRNSRAKIAAARKASIALKAALAAESAAEVKAAITTQAANTAKIRSNAAAALSAQQSAAAQTLAANATSVGLFGRIGALVAANPFAALAVGVTALAVAFDRYVASVNDFTPTSDRLNQRLEDYKKLVDDAAISSDTYANRLRDLRNTIFLVTEEAIKARDAARDAPPGSDLEQYLSQLDNRLSTLARSAQDLRDRLEIASLVRPSAARPDRPPRDFLRDVLDSQDKQLAKAREALEIARATTTAEKERIEAGGVITNLTFQLIALQRKQQDAQVAVNNATSKQRQGAEQTLANINSQVESLTKVFDAQDRIVARQQEIIALKRRTNFLTTIERLQTQNLANVQEALNKATSEAGTNISKFVADAAAFRNSAEFTIQLQAEIANNTSESLRRLDVATGVGRVQAEINHRLRLRAASLAAEAALLDIGPQDDSTRQRSELLNRQLEAIRSGKLNTEEIAKNLQRAFDLQDQAIDAEKERVSLARQFADTLNEGLSRSIASARDLNGVVRSIAANIATAFLRFGLNLALGSLGGGDAGTSPEPTRFAQHGGRVRAGENLIVGEQGRERFIPQTDGRIIPNDRLGGTTEVGVNFSPTINVSSTDAGVRQTIIDEVLPLLERVSEQVKNDVLVSIQRSSPLRKALA